MKIHKCDFCGKEVTEENSFTIPLWTNRSKCAYGRGGVKVAVWNQDVLERTEVDMCDDCQKKAAYLLSMMNSIEMRSN